MVVAAAGATGLGTWEYQRLNVRVSQVSRFSIAPPAGQPLMLLSPGAGGNQLDNSIAISPDGATLLYRTATNGGAMQMVVRPIDQLEAHDLPGITFGREPIFSPDGKWIALSAPLELRKVSVTGGPSIEICKWTGGNLRGMTWGDDDTILFGVDGPKGGVYRVPAGGGEPALVAEPDQAHGETGLWFPSMLPGSRAALVTIPAAVRGQVDNGQIALLDLRTKQRKILVRGGVHAEYAASGHIVYSAGRSLRAVPFDLKRGEVTGDAVPMVEGVGTAVTGEADYALSRTGTLVYVPGSAAAAPIGSQRSLLWVTRDGREEPLGAPPRSYIYPRLSPDGTRVALDIRDQENDIWIWDLIRRTLTRLTFDPGLDRSPLWTPDGRQVLFSSQRAGGGGNVFSQAADGTGTVRRVTTSTDTQYPMSVSPDGTRLIIRDESQKSGEDVAMVALDGKPGTTPLLQTPFNERNAEISPDGHWMAYESNESGMYQIYVRPFPGVDGGRWQISPAGGTRPLWARTGRELFYLDATNRLTAVAVQTTPAFTAGNAAKLFDTQYVASSGNSQRTYDVSPDGKRFLMIKEPPQAERAVAGPSPQMVVVVNWFAELKQRVTAK